MRNEEHSSFVQQRGFSGRWLAAASALALCLTAAPEAGANPPEGDVRTRDHRGKKSGDKQKDDRARTRDHRDKRSRDKTKRGVTRTRDHRKSPPTGRGQAVDHRKGGADNSRPKDDSYGAGEGASSTDYTVETRDHRRPRRPRRPPPPPPASVEVRVEVWEKLSEATDGYTVESKKAEDVPVLIKQIFDEGIPEGAVDVVFVVDTTGSMKDDIGAVKNDMRQILAHLRGRNPDSRIGVVAYRDIHDEFLTRTALFLTDDDARIERAISEITVTGGDDWPEHVYAGINTALDGQPWRAGASQHIILMGDAPPHDDYHNDPRNYDLVTQKAQAAPLRVHIHTIGIKCDDTCRNALAREKRERSTHTHFTP